MSPGSSSILSPRMNAPRCAIRNIFLFFWCTDTRSWIIGGSTYCEFLSRFFLPTAPVVGSSGNTDCFCRFRKFKWVGWTVTNCSEFAESPKGFIFFIRVLCQHWRIQRDTGYQGRLARWIKWRTCDVGEAKEGLKIELWRRWSNGMVGEWTVT